MNIELKLVRSSWILVWIIMHIKIFIQGDGKEPCRTLDSGEGMPGIPSWLWNSGPDIHHCRSSGGIMGAGGSQKSDPLLPAIRSFNDQSVCVLACFQGYALSLNLVLVFRYRISRYS